MVAPSWVRAVEESARAGPRRWRSLGVEDERHAAGDAVPTRSTSAVLGLVAAGTAATRARWVRVAADSSTSNRTSLLATHRPCLGSRRLLRLIRTEGHNGGEQKAHDV